MTNTREAQAQRALRALDRRAFLRGVGGALAIGLLPTGCGSAPAELLPADARALRVLSARSYATFNAAAARLIGGPAPAWIASGRVDPAQAADAWLSRQPALAGTLVQALNALEFAIWPLVPKWRPFTSLAPSAQDAVLLDLSVSSIDLKRDLYRGLRSVTALVFYTQPASRELTGFPGPFGGPSGSIERAMRPLSPDDGAGAADRLTGAPAIPHPPRGR